MSHPQLEKVDKVEQILENIKPVSNYLFPDKGLQPKHLPSEHGLGHITKTQKLLYVALFIELILCYIVLLL